jgi:hypothetical protein
LAKKSIQSWFISILSNKLSHIQHIRIKSDVFYYHSDYVHDLHF